MESNSLMIPPTEVEEDEEVTPIIAACNYYAVCINISPTMYNRRLEMSWNLNLWKRRMRI